MLQFQHRIRQDIDKLAHIITTENGKTLTDAKGDVIRGLEVVEHSCGIIYFYIKLQNLKKKGISHVM